MKEKWIHHVCFFGLWLGPFHVGVWKGMNQLFVLRWERGPGPWHFKVAFAQRFKVGRELVWKRIEGLPGVGIRFQLIEGTAKCSSAT